MAADTDLEPLTITRATAVLVLPGATPWIALRLGQIRTAKLRDAMLAESYARWRLCAP